MREGKKEGKREGEENERWREKILDWLWVIFFVIKCK